MKLKILQAGEPVLRQTTRPLTAEEIRSAEVRELIASMRETMHEAPGVGLAAPQVGYGLQLAVIEDRPEYTRDFTPEQLAERDRTPVPFHVVINPRLELIGIPDVEFFEGCLSLAGLMALVPRTRRVRVECLDENAQSRTIEASGWYARILQHEIDHLRGGLYVDRMNPRTLMTVENYNNFWRMKPLSEVKRQLLPG